jgi:TolB protein
VDGQEACLILPSDDQPEAMEGQAALVVTYPEPISIGDESYAFLILWADQDHIRRIAESVALTRNP